MRLPTSQQLKEIREYYKKYNALRRNRNGDKSFDTTLWDNCIGKGCHKESYDWDDGYIIKIKRHNEVDREDQIHNDIDFYNNTKSKWLPELIAYDSEDYCYMIVEKCLMKLDGKRPIDVYNDYIQSQIQKVDRKLPKVKISDSMKDLSVYHRLLTCPYIQKRGLYNIFKESFNHPGGYK